MPCTEVKVDFKHSLLPNFPDRNEAKHLVLLKYWLAACRKFEHTVLQPCLL